jgi:thiamine-phosphate pyrophosphorylase
VKGSHWLRARSQRQKAILPPLYPILDVDIARSRGLGARELLEAWIGAGVRLVQLRAKQLSSGQFHDLAEALADVARSAGTTFIVNDRADVAKLTGAAGVHVGQNDLSPADARLVVGASAIVGVSTHNDDQVARTLAEPVDYVAIGPVFSTSSKDRPDRVVGLEGVRRARVIVEPAGRPLVAIGGITLERARSVIDAGAESVAVISDLLVGDSRARAREFLRVLLQA